MLKKTKKLCRWWYQTWEVSPHHLASTCLPFEMHTDSSFPNPRPFHIVSVLCCSASLFPPARASFPSFAQLLLLSFVSLCRPCADILLWKGNDPTVLRLGMCATHCNGPAFYCLLHTNPRTEGIRWHLQGAACELQPHMKEWPLKMIKEITILGCTTLLSCLARCTSLCVYAVHTHTHTLIGTWTCAN